MGAAKEYSDPVVKISQGTVVGRTLSESLPSPVDAFRGIPYALPPTGDLRFRPAVKVESSPDSVIDASKYGPAAPGKPLLPEAPNWSTVKTACRPISFGPLHRVLEMLPNCQLPFTYMVVPTIEVPRVCIIQHQWWPGLRLPSLQSRSTTASERLDSCKIYDSSSLLSQC